MACVLVSADKEGVASVVLVTVKVWHMSVKSRKMGVAFGNTIVIPIEGGVACVSGSLGERGVASHSVSCGFRAKRSC